jgi:hypothetical protein
MEGTGLNFISEIWNAFQQSTFLYYVKIIAGLACLVLLVADILLIAKRIEGDVKIFRFGAKIPVFKKNLYQKRWDVIKTNVSSDSNKKRNDALLDADAIFGEVLTKMAVPGKTIEEKIKDLNPNQLAGLSALLEAREPVAKLYKNPSEKLSHEQCDSILLSYERVFKNLELID